MAMKRRRNSMIFNSHEGNRIAQKVAAEIEELGGPSFVALPCAITTRILLRLPVKSVLICKCVCKSWKALISDPKFAKLHFKRAPTSVMIRTNDPKRVSRTLHLLEFEPEKLYHCNYGEDFCSCDENDILIAECKRRIKLEPKFKLPLRDAKLVLTKREETKNGGRKTNYIACNPRDDKFGMVNSCNGFLCLCDPRDRDPLAVCNPVTGEFIRLPETTRIENITKPIHSGFGFHQKTNEYKVIRLCSRDIAHPHHVREWMYVEIHTLGTSTWRNIECDLGYVSELTFPTCVNGALHWICSKGVEGSILCFNFESERFQSFPPPPNLFYYNGRGKRPEYISMVELKGFMYICEACFDEPVRLWVMKEYGIGESWSQVYSVCQSYCWPDGFYWPVKLFNNDAAVLMYHSSNCLLYYDTEYGFKYCKVRGSRRSKFEAIPHILSLISLKDAVKGDNAKVLNVRSRCAKFKLREENEVLYLALENAEMSAFESDDEGWYSKV